MGMDQRDTRAGSLVRSYVPGSYWRSALASLVGNAYTNEIPPTDPLVQVGYVRVVDLDIGASKSDICAIRVVTISERAGRTRACNRGLV